MKKTFALSYSSLVPVEEPEKKSNKNKLLPNHKTKSMSEFFNMISRKNKQTSNNSKTEQTPKKKVIERSSSYTLYLPPVRKSIVRGEMEMILKPELEPVPYSYEDKHYLSPYTMLDSLFDHFMNGTNIMGELDAKYIQVLCAHGVCGFGYEFRNMINYGHKDTLNDMKVFLSNETKILILKEHAVALLKYLLTIIQNIDPAIGWMCMKNCCDYNHIHLLSFLLSDIRFDHTLNNFRLLSDLVRQNKPEYLKLFIEMRKEIDFSYKNNEALRIAIMLKNYLIFSMIIVTKTINLTRENNLAFRLACEYNATEIATFLLQVDVIDPTTEKCEGLRHIIHNKNSDLLGEILRHKNLLTNKLTINPCEPNMDPVISVMQSKDKKMIQKMMKHNERARKYMEQYGHKLEKREESSINE